MVSVHLGPTVVLAQTQTKSPPFHGCPAEASLPVSNLYVICYKFAHKKCILITCHFVFSAIFWRIKNLFSFVVSTERVRVHSQYVSLVHKKVLPVVFFQYFSCWVRVSFILAVKCFYSCNLITMSCQYKVYTRFLTSVKLCACPETSAVKSIFNRTFIFNKYDFVTKFKSNLIL